MVSTLQLIRSFDTFLYSVVDYTSGNRISLASIPHTAQFRCAHDWWCIDCIDSVHCANACARCNRSSPSATTRRSICTVSPNITCTALQTHSYCTQTERVLTRRSVPAAVVSAPSFISCVGSAPGGRSGSCPSLARCCRLCIRGSHFRRTRSCPRIYPLCA